jgi:glycosyltransferase involved in cell wall biosynthesis
MPRLCVTHTSHFVRAPDGRVYSCNKLINRSFWDRYLTAFDEVVIAARVRQVDHVPADLECTDGNGAVFFDLPEYTGPWEYVRVRRELAARLAEATRQFDAYCLRVPCPIGSGLARELTQAGRRFAVEVVGDPWDSLSPGAVRSLIRPIARRSAARQLRTVCLQAIASAYVTREMLQRRYPPSPGAFTTHYSDVELPPEAIADAPRTDFHGAHRLICVGTLAVLYKAQDVLIQSVARAARRDLDLTFVGDGRRMGEMQSLAGSLGIGDRVHFTGQLSGGQAVRDALDASDVFVLPSRQEGLPRAMIEAMARALPCIGSTVGGFPELLPPKDLVPPNDVEALARKIEDVLGDPERLVHSSRRNLEVSREYLPSIREERRLEFYRFIRRAAVNDR